MGIISELKTLSPKQRLFGFILNVVITGLVSIIVAFFNYNDCSSVNKKYETTLENYTQLIDINNSLMQQLNNAKKDMLNIQSYLDEKLLADNYSVSKSTYAEQPKPKLEPLMSFSVNDTLNPIVPNIQYVEPETIKIKETITINKVPKKVIAVHDSIKNITQKYQKN